MVWVVECDDQINSEYEVTVWTSEDDALKHAVHEMILHINKQHHATDPYLVKTVQKISDLLASNSNRGALDCWNDSDYNLDNGGAIFWMVDEYQPKIYKSNGAILDKGRFPFLNKLNQATAPVNGVVNDHTCTNCGNTRCSKQEKSCWVCGAKI